MLSAYSGPLYNAIITLKVLTPFLYRPNFLSATHLSSRKLLIVEFNRAMMEAVLNVCIGQTVLDCRRHPIAGFTTNSFSPLFILFFTRILSYRLLITLSIIFPKLDSVLKYLLKIQIEKESLIKII